MASKAEKQAEKKRRTRATRNAAKIAISKFKKFGGDVDVKKFRLNEWAWR